MRHERAFVAVSFPWSRNIEIERRPTSFKALRIRIHGARPTADRLVDLSLDEARRLAQSLFDATSAASA